MARSPAQSDFVVPAPIAEATVDGEPRATPHGHEASARATRWVLTLTFVMLGILVLMCVIGPHIPAGE